MSRLAKKPVMLIAGVTLKDEGGFLVVKGTKGEIKLKKNSHVTVTVEGDKIWVKEADEGAEAAVGTVWALVRNAIKGVSEGFNKFLDIEGIGYRVVLEGKELVLFLGYALPVRMPIPEGVAIKLEKSSIEIIGIDKDLVGRVAAEIRSLKKPEPYKGKGIRYRGEIVKRKVGKKAGATAGAA
jgi:large subunit ribosomal protein L6